MGQDVDTAKLLNEQNPVRTNRGLPIYVGDHLLTRDVCRDGPRPCPHKTCRQHLGTDHRPSNGRWRERDRPVNTGAFSCALDVAAANPDGLTCKEVGLLMGMTGERVRQIEKDVIQRIEVDQRTQLLQVRRVRNTKLARVEMRMYTYEHDRIKQMAEERGVTLPMLFKSAIGRLMRDDV